MTDRPGYQVPPTTGKVPTRPSESAGKEWVRAIAESVVRVLGGKTNNVLTVNLPNGVGTTTIKDPRIGVYTSFHWQPLTTNAAALLWGAPFIIISSQQDGEATFAHANTANADQNFNLVMIG